MPLGSLFLGNRGTKNVQILSNLVTLYSRTSLQKKAQLFFSLFGSHNINKCEKGAWTYLRLFLLLQTLCIPQYFLWK